MTVKAEYLGDVDILGTKYEIKVLSESDDAKLKETYGYCDPSVKKIVISNMSELASKVDAWADLDEYRNLVLRHEIIHAMLYESGLAEQCEYAMNEELIDWIAIQFGKIEEAYRQADCL